MFIFLNIKHGFECFILQCEHYNKGVIGGSLCVPLCQTGDARLDQYLGDSGGRKVSSNISKNMNKL